MPIYELMNWSFKTRLVLIIGAAQLIFSLVVCVWEYRESYRHALSDLGLQVDSNLLPILNLSKNYIDLKGNDLQGLREQLHQTLTASHLNYVRLKLNSDILVELSDLSKEDLGLIQQESTLSLAKNQVLEINDNQKSKTQKLYLTSLINQLRDGQQIELLVGKSLINLEKIQSHIFFEQVKLSLFQLLLTSILIVYLLRTLSRQFEPLQAACEKISLGDLNVHFRVGGDKEFRKLSYAFQRMSEELRSLLEEKEKQREKLITASKLASLGEMAGGIAHEINNPLAVIVGSAEAIRRRLQRDAANIDPHFVHQKLDHVVKTAGRISYIIKGLMAFARIGNQQPYEYVSLEKIVDDAWAFYTEKIVNEQIDLNVDPVPTVYLKCRPDQITQVLLNLMGNAYDAIADQPEKKMWIHFIVEKNPQSVFQPDQIRIVVQDNGYGVSDSIRNKIMQPFFTTKPVGIGTGLGLSSSLGIAHDHGGELRLEPADFILDESVKARMSFGWLLPMINPHQQGSDEDASSSSVREDGGESHGRGKGKLSDKNSHAKRAASRPRRTTFTLILPIANLNESSTDNSNIRGSGSGHQAA